MRLSLLLLSLGIPHAVLCDTQKDSLEVLNNFEGLSNLKKFVSIASTLSSLVDDSGDSLPPEKPRHAEAAAAAAAADSASDEGPDLLNSVAQKKNVAMVASALFSLIDDQDASCGNEESNEDASVDVDADADVNQDTPDILKSINALQSFASLASGMGSLFNVDEVKKDAQSEGSESPPKAPVVEPQTPKKPESIPREQPKAAPAPETEEMLARLEAIQRISALVKKLTVLTDETNPTPASERLQLLLADPEVMAGFTYVFENAGKMLTPEVLITVKTFLRTSPVIPDEYRTVAVGAADTLGSVFSPEFVGYYRTAKGALDRAGIDLVPVLEFLWRAVQWAKNTLDPAYIKALNKEVLLWRKALTSEEMGEFVEYLTDEETLRRLTASVARMRKSLTPERAHRLHKLFKDQGIFDHGDLEYQAYGDVMGKRIKFYFATEEGISEVERLLDILDGPLHGQTLDDVAGILQTRAQALMPNMADDVATLFHQLSEVTDVVGVLEEILQDIVQLMHPLLDFDTRAARILTWAFWTDLNLILDKILSVPSAGLVTLQKFLVAVSNILEPEQTKGLRLLIADVSGAPRNFGPGGLNDGVVDTRKMLGVLDTESVLAPDVTGDVQRILRGADALLAPGEIGKTRNTVRVLNEAGEFIVQAIQIFETDDAAGETSRHDEL